MAGSALALAADITFGYKHPVTGERTGPFPKQAIAHRCPADILFFGGAAGPGKSEMDVVEAITTVLEFADIEVALFRRKNTELEKSLIGRFRRLAPLDARQQPVFRYNGTLHYADCAITRSRMWFCHAIHEDTVYDYQSAEWVLLIIDEASHFTQFQVDYLQTRVRSARPGMRKRTILTSNPGGVGHGWLKRRFVKPSPSSVQEILLRYNHATGIWEPGNFGNLVQPLDVWRPWPEPDDPTPPEDMDTRCFIPARMEDNPALALADPRYKAKIYALGGAKAKQLAEGDWDANDSMIVGASWRESHQVTAADGDLIAAHGCTVGTVIPWHVLQQPTWHPPATATIFGSVDYGYGAPWAFHLHAVLQGGHTRTFFEFYAAKVRDVMQAALIAWAIRYLTSGEEPPEPAGVSGDPTVLALLASVRAFQRGAPGAVIAKPEWIVGEPVMWNSRQETGNAKSIAEVYIDALTPLNITLRQGAAGRGARVSRPQRWLDALSTAPDGLPWWSVTTACPHLIRTVPEVPWDEADTEVEDGDSENHAYEGVGRFFEARPHQPRQQQAPVYATLDPLSRAHQEAMAKQFDKPKDRVMDMTKAFRGLGGIGR